MHITKSASLPERPCEQLTYCAKNESVQGDYINHVAKRHYCRITGKEKATRYGGPSTQATRYPQRMSIANNATFAAGGQCDQCAGLLVGYSCSLASPYCDVFQVCDPIFVRLYSFKNFSRTNAHGANLSCSCSLTVFLRCFFLDEDNFFNDLSVIVDTCNPMHHSSPHHGAGDGYSCSLALRRWRRLISSRIFLGKKPAGLFSGRESLLSVCFSVIHQPLGSIPRRFSSARPNSLSQLARLTPSLLASLSNCSFNSGTIRIWNGGAFPVPFCFLSRLITVDMCTPMALCFGSLGVHLNTCTSKNATPRSGGTHAGRLTTNDNDSIEVAMLNHTTHTQGRDSHNLNKYIWRFIALSTAQPRVIHIVATSEQEARQQSPAGCVMVFAARIRQGGCHA
ncbi:MULTISPECIES: host cell division inhibitor Icd-like protein [Escherichia]|nr:MULTISPECIES: host cell division inhibitor Icd-like protein [Escherichia]MEC4937696.1 host cell division inhibitor Icd-like protein [Escherichia coli]MEC4958723.1 host cell division inhibitor Icd-like protein [Escherichia coli]MEC5047721.1 host cell division inhibitor Icd-like protein [Escherichia coli]MEC5063660.1 host cell division inhibitor Icd-like protein [Escherichia coli]MEC5083903.1 host cell division inhibitor Icd-like protein [Escherichia coli]